MHGTITIKYRQYTVVSFLLGKSPASLYYCMPTFRNSLSVLVESSKTSAYNNTVTPGTYPKERKLQSKHGESLKSRNRQYTFNVTLRNVRVNIFCRGKEIIFTCSECLPVAVVIQYAKGMRLILLSFVICPAVPYFSILSHKRHDCRKRVVLHAMCVLTVAIIFV